MGASTAPRPAVPESIAPAPQATSTVALRPAAGVTVGPRPVVPGSTAPRPRGTETIAQAGHVPPPVAGVVVRALTVEIDVEALLPSWQIRYSALTAEIVAEALIPPTVVPIFERALIVDLTPTAVEAAWPIRYSELTVPVPVDAILPALGDEVDRPLVAEMTVEAIMPTAVILTRALVVELPVDVSADSVVVLSRSVVAEVGVSAAASSTLVLTSDLVAEINPALSAPAVPVLERPVVAEVPVSAITPPAAVLTRELVAEVIPTATAPGAVVTFVAMGVDKSGTQDPGRNTWTQVSGWTVRSGYPGTVESGGALIAEGSGATTIHAQVKFNTGVIFISKGARLKVNGTVVATSQDSASKTTYTLSYGTTLNDGDVVTVEAYHSATTATERNVLAGSTNTFLYWD